MDSNVSLQQVSDYDETTHTDKNSNDEERDFAMRLHLEECRDHTAYEYKGFHQRLRGPRKLAYNLTNRLINGKNLTFPKSRPLPHGLAGSATGKPRRHPAGGGA